MTVRSLCGSMVRHWYVVLLAMAAAAGGFVLLEQHGGIYSTKPVVAFLLPGGKTLEMGSGLESQDVIAFATTVAQEINNGRPAELYSRDSAPLYGAGMRQEIRISVPSDGTQWRASYPRAEIAVSIVGPDRAWVETMQRRYVRMVRSVAEDQQNDVGVTPTERIQTKVMPLTTDVEYVGAGKTAQVVAMSALLAAATIVAAWLSVMLDRLARRTRR
jgi:hypothetical protein